MREETNESEEFFGKKIGMTQVFRPDGQVVPVPAQSRPCTVVQRSMTSSQNGSPGP